MNTFNLVKDPRKVAEGILSGRISNFRENQLDEGDKIMFKGLFSDPNRFSKHSFSADPDEFHLIRIDRLSVSVITYESIYYFDVSGSCLTTPHEFLSEHNRHELYLNGEQSNMLAENIQA